MSNQRTLSFINPKAIYTFISLHAVFAAVVIFYSFAHFDWDNSSLELIISTILLIVLAKWNILYYVNPNFRTSLTFYYPIMLLFGLIPIIISDLIAMLFFNRERPFIKRFFNMAKNVNVFAVSYLLYQWMLSTFPAGDQMVIVPIIITAIFLSTFAQIQLQIVVYFENRGKVFHYPILFNVYVSNILNGVITFYLYQTLGMAGIFITVAYAVLFSIRIKYQTAYSQKKEELFESEQRARIVFDTIDYGIIMLDKNYQIKMLNRKMQQFLATFDPEPIGKPLHQVFPNVPIELKRMLQLTYEHQDNFHHKKVLLKNDDGNLYFDIHSYPQLSVEGNMVGVILLFKNITEEQLIRSQLIEADKLSRIGEIAAEKVHEIKNPLTTVRGYMQFLRHKVAKGETLKINDFDVALQEIDRTNEIINSLLILSKEPNQQKEVICIDQLLDEVIQLFQHQLFIKGITLYREFQKKLYIAGVENHLKQIMINLLLNAIDAVADKKENPMITIHAYERECKLFIEVEDNGTGIDEKDIVKLKMPFYTTKKNGSGLGLSVTYKLVEEHHGSIDIESERGKGTVFRIAFLMDENICKQDNRELVNC